MVTTQKPETPTKTDPHASSDEKRSTTTDIDKLARSWRSLVSSIVVTTRAAEKLALHPNASGKELDDAVEQTVRARQDFRRYLTTIEAKLLGQAKETEALTGMLQSQPSTGCKRKRLDTDSGKYAEIQLNPN
jgi:hypothetical protein